MISERAILVVEDDASLRIALESFLGAAGYLSKPFEGGALLAAIDSATGSRIEGHGLNNCVSPRERQ